jgi:hypothetical protein
MDRDSNHIYINPSPNKPQENQTPQSQSPTNTKEKHLLLPITGSEYLEKMVQLPFCIPPIDTQDVKAFLEQRYERFRPQEPKTQTTPTPREQFDEQPQESNQPNQRLLEFFATHIPPKPRKIIRTINLFESKEELMHSLGVDSILLAKLTLLELFAPKLFRSMQTKGFVRLFRWLVKWKSAHNSLSETMAIHQAILKAELPQIDRDSFLYLLGIIEQYYKSRVEFSLDMLFGEDIDEKLLLRHIAFKAKKRAIELRHQVTKSSFLRGY